MKRKIETKNDLRISRVYVTNKRDKLEDYIFNCVANYNEYLFQKISTSKLNDLNNLVDDKNKFAQKTKLVLQEVKDMKKIILEKRKEFITIVKNYANSFVQENKYNTNKNTVEIEKEANINVEKIRKEMEEIEKEKQNLINLKKVNVEITKNKIREIRKEIYNDTKFNLDFESQEVQNLVDSHKKFIKNKIEIKTNILENKLVKINNEIKKLHIKKIDDVYKIVEQSKKRTQNEFIFLSEIEQKVVKEIIKFNDFLEDVEYFANDKTRKYEIIFAKAKKIKADNSNKIMKDINQSLSFISNSENIFDNVDLLIINANQKIDDKILKNKLNEFKDSVLNTSSQKFIADNSEREEKFEKEIKIKKEVKHD